MRTRSEADRSSPLPTSALGFVVGGVVGTAAAALATIRASLTTDPIELILLDMNLPDGRGIEAARRLRSAGIAVDIIAITAVRDIDMVHPHCRRSSTTSET